MNAVCSGTSTYRASRIKQLPLREQPAYRIAQQASACSLVELLAAVVGGGQQLETAEGLVAHFGDLARLHRAPLAEIAALPGIGPATAVRIKAALALSQRLLDPYEDRPLVKSPADAAALVQAEMSLFEQEHLRVILLDTRNRVLDIVEIYHGSLNAALVRLGEVFRPAVQRLAASMIVVHNHPSGDPTPSPEDESLTRAMVQAGKLLDICLLDHLVIGSAGRYSSLKEHGQAFGER